MPFLQNYLKNTDNFMRNIMHHILAKLGHISLRIWYPWNNNNQTRTKWQISENFFNQNVEEKNPIACFKYINNALMRHSFMGFYLGLLQNKMYEIPNHFIEYKVRYCIGKKLALSVAILENLITIPVNNYHGNNLHDAYLSLVIPLFCQFLSRSRQMAKAKAVLMLIEQGISKDTFRYMATFVNVGFRNLIPTMGKQWIKLMPFVIKLLQPLLRKFNLHHVNLEIISLCSKRLIELHCSKASMNFIEDNSYIILTEPFNLGFTECEKRQTHCIFLLNLLNVYMIRGDCLNINRVLKRLQEFRQSLLVHASNAYCYCFMGTKDCKHRLKEQIKSFPRPSQDKECLPPKLAYQNSQTSTFSENVMSLVQSRLPPPITRMESFKQFFSKKQYSIRKVINGELRLVWYLKHMIDLHVQKRIIDQFREGALEKFTLLIESLWQYNETWLFDIIKTLCVLKIQPEMQDVFIQGLTQFLHLICNKPHSFLSKLLLDMHMTCLKGEFLEKLTMRMAKHLISPEEDTIDDVKKIIYKCFCTVRHENKVTDRREINIDKYKEHLTFITTIESEEEMQKLSDRRRFLVMLVLLIISSGGLQTSAKLKKFLSLKYAYDDAILYLLWCSGDVENNPGPTFKKLSPQADSIKKRNWIHEMCTTTLKLLKDKTIDSKTNDLWKEKPDGWQILHDNDKPFYDPRNKPKGKQLSIQTDEELLNCLLKCCDLKSITLPSNFRKELTASKSDEIFLLELCVTRNEIAAIKMAKDLLGTYRNAPDLKQNLNFFNVEIFFNPKSKYENSLKGYSDVVRELAITFCRISKGLPIFEKSDGIWKNPPQDWNPNHLYYSPCNTRKRHEKHQDQKLVDNLLIYCERKSISIPSELQPVVKEWKLKNSNKIFKRYTIWSCVAKIQHSLKYLELEGLLEKQHVQQSLKQIGISFDIECQKCPKHLNNKSTIIKDNESKTTGHSINAVPDNHSRCSSSSESNLDSVCSEYPQQTRVFTKCKKKVSKLIYQETDFPNQPSTSKCSMYSKRSPCHGCRVGLQSSNDCFSQTNIHTRLSEIYCAEPDFQPSTSRCSIYTKQIQCKDLRDDLLSKQKRVEVILLFKLLKL